MKDELVDILDEQGNKTGQVLMKSEAHAKSLWHPVSHLWIYDSKGNVLLQKRSHHKLVWPDKWDLSAAGHLAAGELPKEAMVKEAREELGLRITADELKFVDIAKFQADMGGWMNRIFIWIYIAQKYIDINKLTLEEEEVSQVKWMHVDELEATLNDPEKTKSFSPDIQIYSRMVFAEIRRKLKQSL